MTSHYFVVTTYSGLLMLQDLKEGVKARSRASPPVLLRLKEMVLVALPHLHLLQDPVFEKTGPQKAMAHLVVRLDVMLCSVKVPRSCLGVRPLRREDMSCYSLC